MITAAPFDTALAIGTFLPLAEAAYDITHLPTGWTVVAKLEPLEYGFLAVKGATLAICFRGTESHSDWCEDFEALPCDNFYGQGHIHMGFAEIYESVRAGLIEAYRKQSFTDLLITGHSLGAALAILCAGDIVRGGRAPRVYTFAGPRVGLRDFADWFAANVPECYRIVNEWDIVPHQPNSITGYRHVGHGVLVNGGRTVNLRVAHSLALSYGPGLAKMMLADNTLIAKVQ